MDLNKNLGLCIKNQKKIVEFQNDLCIKTCGKMLGEICEKGCMENYTNHPSKYSEGMSLIKNSKVDGNFSDAVIINDNQSLVTIFYPLESKHQAIGLEVSELKEFGLTKAELEIIQLKVSGMMNGEISKKLFIARSTLKTHLNNIYKKLPPKWQFLKERK